MKLFESVFDKVYNELSTLNEAKQDTARFINFFMNNHYNQKDAED
jgi:hypothetical protein